MGRWHGALLASILLAVQATATTTRAANAPVKHPWQLPTRRARAHRDKHSHQVVVTFSFRDAITPAIRTKLQSGLPTTIVLAGGAFDATSKRPIPGAAVWQSCKVAFDVWNEVYRIRIQSSAGDHRAVALGLGGVMRRCGEARDLPITSRLGPGRRLFVAATVEINPISQKMLDNIRRWVTRPPGSSSVGPGDSLFGSFVGMFIARIGRVDRRISFRTNVFTTR